MISYSEKNHADNKNDTLNFPVRAHDHKISHFLRPQSNPLGHEISKHWPAKEKTISTEASQIQKGE